MFTGDVIICVTAKTIQNNKKMLQIKGIPYTKEHNIVYFRNCEVGLILRAVSTTSMTC